MGGIARRQEIILFLAFVLVTTWCANGPRNPNSVTRVGLAHSIALHGRLNIDEVAPYTIDKAHWNGHYYCDKAPGISLLCTPAVYVADHAANLVGAQPNFIPAKNVKLGLRYGLEAIACQLLTSVLFGAAAVVAFRRTLLRAEVSQRSSNAAAIVFAFGTPFLMWSTAVFGHATSTALLVLAFSLRWIDPEERPFPVTRFLLAGALLSLAVLVELTAAPAAAMIALLLLQRSRKSSKSTDAAALVLAGVPAAAALLTYNYLAFGSPFHLGYASVEGFTGMKTGFFGINLPTREALWGITFSPDRGIFWLSPILLFSVPAFIDLLRRSGDRSPIIVCLGIALYYFFLNSGYHYWNGGYSLGPRHVTPAIPFLLFPIAFWADRVRLATRATLAVSAGLSVAIMVACTSVTFRVPDDGRSLLGGNLFAKVAERHSDTVIATLHVPFLIVVTVPALIVLVATSLLFLPQGNTRKFER